MIEARYDGKCPGCGEQIKEGDDIGLVDREWCCEACVEEHGEDFA